MSRCDKIIMDRIYAITHLYGRFEKKWYMPKFTSTGGLRGNRFYLAKMVSGIVRLYVTMVCLLWTTERKKERNSSSIYGL